MTRLFGVNVVLRPYELVHLSPFSCGGRQPALPGIIVVQKWEPLAPIVSQQWPWLIRAKNYTKSNNEIGSRQSNSDAHDVVWRTPVERRFTPKTAPCRFIPKGMFLVITCGNRGVSVWANMREATKWTDECNVLQGHHTKKKIAPTEYCPPVFFIPLKRMRQSWFILSRHCLWNFDSMDCWYVCGGIASQQELVYYNLLVSLKCQWWQNCAWHCLSTCEFHLRLFLFTIPESEFWTRTATLQL